jgi:hypothetical protein
MKKPLILIDDFKGGMTLNPKMGRKDQFYKGWELDFRSRPGFLTTGHKWTTMEYSSSVELPTEFRSIIQAAYDGKYYFGGEDAKIYEQSASSTIIARLDSDQAGEIRDMEEYEDYMYYRQDTTIGRKSLAGQSDWSDAVNNWQTGKTNLTYAPIFAKWDRVFFANGRYLDQYDNTTYTSAKITLPAGWKIRCLTDFGNDYLAIVANFYAGSNRSRQTKIFLWNGTSTIFDDMIPIPEVVIKAVIFESGYLWVWAGRSCNIYVIQENSRSATRMHRFNREDPTSDFEVYPNAVTSHDGMIHFALSDVDAISDDHNPCGVYSFPADPHEFNLNIPYKQSYKYRFKSLQIINPTGIVGPMLYLGERHYITGGSEEKRLYRESIALNEYPYSIGAYWYSFIYSAPKNKKMFTERFGVMCEALPAGTSFRLYYKADNGSWTVATSTINTTNTLEEIVDLRIEANYLQLYLLLTASTSTTNRPVIKSIFVTGHLMSKS